MIARVPVVLVGVQLALVACSGAQSKADAQLATITAGCKVALDLELEQDAGAAHEATSEGCRAAIKTWMAVGAPDAGAP